MTTPQRPMPPGPGPFNTNAFPSTGMEVLHEGDSDGPEKRYNFWRMLRLTAALIAILAVIVLGIRFLSPAPENTPPPDNSGAGINGTPIDRDVLADMLDSGIASYEATIKEVGGVNLALTSHLLAPNGNGLLQVGFNPDGDHILYSFDLAAEPTPIRFTRGDTTYLNMTTPYPANTLPVAKVRDTEFIGEWSLSDPQDPATNIPSLPDVARAMLESVSTATKGTSADGLSTQVVATIDGFAATNLPDGLLSSSIEGEAQASFLFDKEGRLVGVSLLSKEALEGNANAPQVTYVVPVGGFAAVDVPPVPQDPGVAPENLPATGPWSNLVTLAIDLQRTARVAAAGLDSGQDVTDYNAEVMEAVSADSGLSQQLTATKANFDAATALLTDSEGRVVCLPLGVIAPGQDVSSLSPTVYLDLCPSGEVAAKQDAETPAQS